MKSLIVFLGIQLAIFIFVFSAYGGGCTTGVIKAMQEVGINEKNIDDICELAKELDMTSGGNSSHSAGGLTMEVACKVAKEYKNVWGKKIKGDCSDLSAGLQKALICVGSYYLILLKTDRGWKAVDELRGATPCP